MFNIKEELRIDPYVLDEECLDQGRKIMTMAELYSEAVEERDRAKLQTEVVYANLSLKVRRNPEAYGLKDKPSDKQVDAVVLTQPLYIKARHRLIRATKDCELYKPGLDAFKDRSIQIGRLINMRLEGIRGGTVHLTQEAEAAVDRTRTEHDKELLNKNPRLNRLKRGATDAN